MPVTFDLIQAADYFATGIYLLPCLIRFYCNRVYDGGSGPVIDVLMADSDSGPF